MPAAFPREMSCVLAQAAERGPKLIVLNDNSKKAPYSRLYGPLYGALFCYFQFLTTWRRYIVEKLSGWCRKIRTSNSMGLSGR